MNFFHNFFMQTYTQDVNEAIQWYFDNLTIKLRPLCYEFCSIFCIFVKILTSNVNCKVVTSFRTFNFISLSR